MILAHARIPVSVRFPALDGRHHCMAVSFGERVLGQFSDACRDNSDSTNDELASNQLNRKGLPEAPTGIGMRCSRPEAT